MQYSIFFSALQANYERVTHFVGPSVSNAMRISLASKYTFAGISYSGVAFEKKFHELQALVERNSTFTDMFIHVKLNLQTGDSSAFT